MTDIPTPDPTGPDLNNLANAFRTLEQARLKGRRKRIKMYGPDGKEIWGDAHRTHDVAAAEFACPVCAAVDGEVMVPASNLTEHRVKAKLCGECQEQLTRGYIAVVCQMDRRYTFLTPVPGTPLESERGNMLTVNSKTMDALEAKGAKLREQASAEPGVTREPWQIEYARQKGWVQVPDLEPYLAQINWTKYDAGSFVDQYLRVGDGATVAWQWNDVRLVPPGAVGVTQEAEQTP